MDIRVNTRMLDRLARQTPERLDRITAGAAHGILTDIVRAFGSGPDGRDYRRGGVTHTASQPGYPPNVDTGALRGSMQVQRVGHAHYRVSDGVEYGIYLELGTTWMAPRPFVTPVVEDWSQSVFARFIRSSNFLR